MFEAFSIIESIHYNPEVAPDEITLHCRVSELDDILQSIHEHLSSMYRVVHVHHLDEQDVTIILTRLPQIYPIVSEIYADDLSR